MRKRRIATAPRRIGLELRRATAQHGTADCRVALRVCGRDPLVVDLRIRRQELPCARCIARADLDLELGREVAELGEPEAMLVDEVERQAIAPRGDRTAHLQLTLDPLAGLCVDIL